MPCVHTHVFVSHVHTSLLFTSHSPLLSTRHIRHVSFLRAEPAEPSSPVNLRDLPGFGSSTLQTLANIGFSGRLSLYQEYSLFVYMWMSGSNSYTCCP